MKITEVVLLSTISSEAAQAAKLRITPTRPRRFVCDVLGTGRGQPCRYATDGLMTATPAASSGAVTVGNGKAMARAAGYAHPPLAWRDRRCGPSPSALDKRVAGQV
jgi:hypothetical protein